MLRKVYKRLKLILSQLSLVLKSLWYFLFSLFRVLPGLKFDFYGRLLGFKYFLKKKRFCPLLVNPVSSVRYFEFGFIARNIPMKKGAKILDVSSPWLFGMWVVKYNEVDYSYINPDEREFSEIKPFININNGKGSYMFSAQDALGLSYKDCTFDYIVSISVIEHISGSGDSRAISEMWRVLKPGGKLILTFPVMRIYEEEYRNENIYSLPNVNKKDDSYFFQRFYDENTIATRLLSHLSGYKVEARELFGEIEDGFFKEHEKRWISGGLKETVKDPWYMATKMQRYSHIGGLTGLGVMGLSIQKVA